jgi:hypothetical protein
MTNDNTKRAASSRQQAAGHCRSAAVCLLLSACCVLNSGCYKDEVDIAALNNNPFDPGYAGPNVFSFDTTYTEPIPGTPESRQVFQFRVNSSLFLAPQDYSVQVVDELLPPMDPYVHQVPPGNDVLRYYRNEIVFGQEVCLRLSLSNNYHQGRAETVCGTLQ